MDCIKIDIPTTVKNKDLVSKRREQIVLAAIKSGTSGTFGKARGLKYVNCSKRLHTVRILL